MRAFSRRGDRSRTLAPMAEPIRDRGAARGARRVTRADLEARLDQLRATIADPRAGLFGPGSKVWEVNRHSIAFLGAGRAALLQLAHPWVASTRRRPASPPRAWGASCSGRSSRAAARAAAIAVSRSP